MCAKEREIEREIKRQERDSERAAPILYNQFCGAINQSFSRMTSWLKRLSLVRPSVCNKFWLINRWLWFSPHTAKHRQLSCCARVSVCGCVWWIVKLLSRTLFIRSVGSDTTRHNEQVLQQGGGSNNSTH